MASIRPWVGLAIAVAALVMAATWGPWQVPRTPFVLDGVATFDDGCSYPLEGTLTQVTAIGMECSR